MEFRRFNASDRAAVIGLWDRCDLLRPWNDPNKDIDRKMNDSPELFLVGESNGAIVASAMVGYDGHRGAVNYLAIDPGHQRSGHGSKLMTKIESMLLERGCPKINIQIRNSNLKAVEFYQKIGYKLDEVINITKRLIED